MNKKVIIIGAGIAGMTAGCYLQMNGYETEIFEMNSLPGGLCTSWKRNGYTFDGCIHFLVGSNPPDPFYNLWNELIDMNKIDFLYPDYYYKVEDKKGNTITIYNDLNKLEKELLEKSPEDKINISRFISAVRKFSRFNLPIDKPQEVMTFTDGIKIVFKILPFMNDFKKWTKISTNEFAAGFKNNLLKEAFSIEECQDLSVFFNIMRAVWSDKQKAGYPIGGSLYFSKLIENKYYELGGKINYDSRVVKILTQNNSASGIQTNVGNKFEADIIISAGDGYDTIFNLLEGKFTNEKIENYYKNFTTFPSYLQVSLGVGRTFENEPHYLFFPLTKSIRIDDKTSYDRLPIRIFNFDKNMAPEGKTAMQSLFVTTEYKYWNDLKNNNLQKYTSEKERIAGEVTDALEKRFGNIKSRVETIDVSTPSTIIRFTNNWKGSYEGWLPTKESGFQSLKRTLPGLNNFYMAGQWVEVGGGIPACLLSGRNVTQIICKKDKRIFKTTHY